MHNHDIHEQIIICPTAKFKAARKLSTTVVLYKSFGGSFKICKRYKIYSLEPRHIIITGKSVCGILTFPPRIRIQQMNLGFLYPGIIRFMLLLKCFLSALKQSGLSIFTLYLTDTPAVRTLVGIKAQ